MRNLLAENLEKGAGTRTVAAISERNSSDASVDVADASDTPARPAPQQIQPAASAPEAPPPRTAPASRMSALAAATAAMPPARVEPAPLTNGVIASQPLSIIPGSSEPMKPVRVKTVQVKAGAMKLASAAPAQAANPITSTIPAAHADVAETSSAVVAKAEIAKADVARAEINKSEINKAEIASPEPKADIARSELPQQPAGFGTGKGILGVLPASAAAVPAPARFASAEPAPQAALPPILPAAKPAAAHSGWIVQVGALESESEAQQRIDAARSSARGLLSKADPFTETVVAKDNRKLVRARFAGLERDQAEAVCRALKRADISCITVRN
jgi:D-alanyl-D-alanine carboxypeptidase